MHRAHTAYAQQAIPDDERGLLERYGHVVERAARRLAARVGSRELADELWSAGALGLLDAARRYDGERGIRFETFVEHRVRGAMLDELRRMDHLPRRLRQQVDLVKTAGEKLAAELGRAAEPAELAVRTGLEVAQVEELRQLNAPLVPLEHAAEISTELPDAHDTAERNELAGVLTRQISGLSERLQLVLSLHYVEGLTYREIAQVLKVSEPRVCQLHGDALKQLRAAMNPS